MYYHNKAQQSKNRVHISWDILSIYHTRSGAYMYMLYMQLQNESAMEMNWISCHSMIYRFLSEDVIAYTRWHQSVDECNSAM